MTHHATQWSRWGWLCAVLLAAPCMAADDAMPSPTSRLNDTTRVAIRTDADGPRIIAHRGASALRPEHTLAAYAKAIEDGADFVEPDLVMTRDGVLVARHENEIGGTTDVADHPRFSGRKTLREIDGVATEGWFAEDFTLEELRTLRARERLPELRGTTYDGQFTVPTLDDIIEYVAALSVRAGRDIGLVPEIKHSSHLHAHGLDPEAALLEVLMRHDYARRVPFGVQSFEVSNLQRLRTLLDAASLDNVFLVQLIGAPEASPQDHVLAGIPTTYLQLVSSAEARAGIARYAHVLAPHLRYILPIDDKGALASPTPLVQAAHAAGLAVHVWTLRPENHFLPPALRCPGDAATRCLGGTLVEARALADAGVDALFTDDPGSLAPLRSEAASDSR